MQRRWTIIDISGLKRCILMLLILIHFDRIDIFSHNIGKSYLETFVDRKKK